MAVNEGSVLKVMTVPVTALSAVTTIVVPTIVVIVGVMFLNKVTVVTACW